MIESKVHLRDYRRAGHYALCGEGYSWPSGIRFEREDQKCTCKECIEKSNDLVIELQESEDE